MAKADSAASKAKAVIAARSKAKGKGNSQSSYYIWVGGACGSIVIAMIVLLVNPDKGPNGTSVNDDSLITLVNRNAKTWTASAASFFDGWTLGDAKMLEGVSVSGMGGNIPPCQESEVDIPKDFDARQQWPQCFNSPIYNMGNCTASWAITAASSLSNRFCISNPTDYSELMLSPQQLLSCDTANRGCGGGDIDSAWNYISREGLVSEICFPYQGADSDIVKCGSKCSTEDPLRAGSICQLSNEKSIKREVMANGPVVAPLFLTDDFLVYQGGLYQELPTTSPLANSQRQRIIHAVKVIGWGKLQGQDYWLIENSWGEDWGEHGYAKVLAAGPPEKREGLIVETFAIAGMPASSKVDDDDDPDFDVDLDDLDADLDDEDADLD